MSELLPDFSSAGCCPGEEGEFLSCWLTASPAHTASQSIPEWHEAKQRQKSVYLKRNSFYFLNNKKLKGWFSCRLLIFFFFSLFLENLASPKFELMRRLKRRMHFAPSTETKLQDVIRDESAWHIINLLYNPTHPDRPLVADLTPYLCRQRKWREWNGSTSSHTLQLHTMCSLVNQHLKNSAQRQLAWRPSGTTAQAGDLCAHTEAQRLHQQHPRHSRPSRVFLQTKFPSDNRSARCILGFFSLTAAQTQGGWQLAHLMCASPVLIPLVVRWQGPACDLDQGLDCRLLRKSGEFSMERASVELITGNYSLRALQKKSPSSTNYFYLV